MGIGTERLQLHLLGSKQEALICCKAGEEAAWCRRLIKAFLMVTGAPSLPTPELHPSELQPPLAISLGTVNASVSTL